MFEAGLETSAPCTPLSTAQHPPGHDESPSPYGDPAAPLTRGGGDAAVLEAGAAPAQVPVAAGPGLYPDERVDACDLVTVPSRQGLEAVDILRRGAAEAVGPVLHDDDHDTLSFLVPPGTADAWDVPGSDCTHSDGVGTPLPATCEPPVEGAGWLVPPGEADPVTDPADLRAALGEAERMIRAADSCRWGPA